MNINEKLKYFFLQKKMSQGQIAEDFGGVTSQSIGLYLNGKRDIPTDFIIWLKKKFPDIDLNKLFINDENSNIYFEKEEKIENKKEKILAEFTNLLNKHLK